MIKRRDDGPGELVGQLPFPRGEGADVSPQAPPAAAADEVDPAAAPQTDQETLERRQAPASRVAWRGWARLRTRNFLPPCGVSP